MADMTADARSNVPPGVRTDEKAPSDTPWARVRSAADLGAFARNARLRANVSQDALAAELGIDRRVLQRIEAGTPTLYTARLFSLLKRLDVDIELRQR